MQQSGVFLVNKPVGITTNQLIQELKHRLKINKIGHAGTLDPLADGLVLVLVNQGTKLSPFLLNEKKGYTSTLELFTSTDTADREGKVLATEHSKIFTKQQIAALTKKFNNYQYEQQPPIYSAIKIKGKKLYQYARHQEEITIPKRLVTIYNLDIEDYNPHKKSLKFTTTVSKGTYIRSLAEDIAKHLGTIGHVTQLTRIQSGNFKLNQAKNLETINWNDLINLYDVLTIANHPIIKIDQQLESVLHGKPISLPKETPAAVFIANDKNEILAYYGRREDNLYYCLRGGFTNY